jgi:hypothetical protein
LCPSGGPSVDYAALLQLARSGIAFGEMLALVHGFRQTDFQNLFCFGTVPKNRHTFAAEPVREAINFRDVLRC